MLPLVPPYWEKAPTAVLSTPVVLNSPACVPINILSTSLTKLFPALYPIATALLPVKVYKAFTPIAIVPEPLVVTLYNDSYPIAILSAPVVIAWPALCPKHVLRLPLLIESPEFLPTKVFASPVVIDPPDS